MKTALLCAAAMLAAAPTLAQETITASAPQVLVVQKVSVGSSLPSNTEVWVSLNSGLTSKDAKVGNKFDLTVSRDVMMGDYVVIPRGTPAHGQISYRTGKGAFGKSAKMEFDLVDVQVGQRYIPVSGHYRIEGSGNTGAAVGAVVAVGVFGAFVTGHSATAGQGSEWKAYTKEPIMIALAPPVETVAAAPQSSAVVAPAVMIASPSAPTAAPSIAPATPAAQPTVQTVALTKSSTN